MTRLFPILAALIIAGCASTEPALSPADRTRERMTVSIDLDWDGTRLADVFDEIAARTGVRIEPRWAVLKRDVGWEPGTTVTLNLQSVPADKALDLILEYHSGPAVGYEITDDGTVIVSTVEDLRK